MYLYLDSEFRSELDLYEVGSYKYIGHPSTELLMIAYAFGGEDIKLWQPIRKEDMPNDLREGLTNELQILCAHNCNFERLGFRKHLGIDIHISRWEDTMVRSRYLSMPGSLEKVGKILDIQDKKLKEFFIKDQSMVDFFCFPIKMGGYETLFGIEPTQYRDWETHPREWDKFGEYCVVDVAAMREIMNRESKFVPTDFEYEVFELHEQINDRGIYTDSILMQGAAIVVEKEFEYLRKEFYESTGINNPRSTPSVLRYVRDHGYTFTSLNKKYVNRALKGECVLDSEARKALELRLQLSKSSVSKLESLRSAVESDGRVRGLFNYLGAARTGRWTSGIVQVQNLVKPSKEVSKKQEHALKLLKAGDYESIKKEFSSPIDVACSALRPMFRAPQGKKLVIADLSAIESCGAGWVANCPTLLEIFYSGKDPYVFFAALMEGVDYEVIEAIVKKGDKTKRTNAKAPFLGCFGRWTEVLTSNGVKCITEVTSEDKLWDGNNWVPHDGVVYRGYKSTIDLAGVRVTPDHKILCGEYWREAWEVDQDILLENRAINLAIGLYPNAEKSVKDCLRSKLLKSNPNVVEPTFDLSNSGPQNRFTILTENGPMIVHNCGYGLGTGEITQDEEGNTVKTGLLGYADSMGIELSPEYADQAVQVYRNAYHEVVSFWYDLQNAFVNVIEHGGSQEIGPLCVEQKGRVIAIVLPSGRALHYINPQVTYEDRISKKGNPYKASKITIEGINQKTHQWERIDTRGTKLFENVVQAICRDILACGMIEAAKRGFEIVLHCHDEIMAEVPENGELGVQELVECMTKPIVWAPEFPLKAAGFETMYYKKDD